MGAPQGSEVAAEDTQRVNNCKDAINQKTGKNYESFKVDKVSHQVVAGTNHFYHLTAQPGDDKWTVTIFEPLPGGNAQCEVSEVSQGHKDHLIGHGSQ